MQELRKYYAMIKLFFHIPHPETLSDAALVENIRQLEWLAEKGLLGIKRKTNQ